MEEGEKKGKKITNNSAEETVITKKRNEDLGEGEKPTKTSVVCAGVRARALILVNIVHMCLLCV